MGARVAVNKIIPFSLVDGPGSRTSVFLQGCNIACTYCHNPETQRACIHCGVCVESCPVGALSIVDGKVVWDEDVCTGCDTCIRVCPHYSTPKTRLVSAQQVFEQVSGYAPFIRGITVSGGECMLEPEWMLELFELCHGAGLSCLIDTNGTLPFSSRGELLAACDGVMLDVKAWDPEVAERLTEQSAAETATVKKNLALLAREGKLEEIRVVVVDGLSDPEATLEGIAEALGALTGEQRLRLIKFRCFGVRGELADAASPTDERMEELVALAHTLGFSDVVVS